ncbi:coiled-coil domain-containing protein 74A-like isoform X2 [Rhopilema esculentum]|uniref:coiled-coil domain-containing protein 74A-like isoform X2 n=1 Tax=Rhopilema esculentum TaxID=499914 RepID=UPI0031D6121A
MDLISGHSPSSSVSPPISPIKLYSQPTTGLPPLKNLPVWNRTGLEKNRFIRSITKDSQEIGKTEFVVSPLTSKGTQTSPPGTAFARLERYSNNNDSGKDKFRVDDNSAMVADKKLYFVQAEHEGVLKKLHVELDRLKNQNRDLTFKLVMTNTGFSVSPDSKDTKDLVNRREGSGKPRQPSLIRKQTLGGRSDGKRDSFSKEETKRQKASYRSAGSKASRTEDSTRSGLYSAKHSQKEQKIQHQTINKNNSPYLPSKSIEVVEQKESLFSKPAASVLQNETSHDTNTPALITGKDYTPEDYEEIIRNLKRLNAKQASELSHLKEKLVEKRGRYDDLYLPSTNHLPKIDLRNASKSAKLPPALRGKHQIVSLPALKPILGSKVTNRQRKAQASHVQRQRSNKDIAQKLI